MASARKHKCEMCGVEIPAKGNSRYCETCREAAKWAAQQRAILRQAAKREGAKTPKKDIQWKCRKGCHWYSAYGGFCDRYSRTGKHFRPEGYTGTAEELMLAGCPHYIYDRAKQAEDERNEMRAKWRAKHRKGATKGA